MLSRARRIPNFQDNGRTIVRWVSLVGMAGSLSACGNPAPKSSSNVPQPAPTPPASAEIVEKEPATLFFIARIKEPRGSVGRIAEWCNLPFGLDDALTDMGKEVPKLLRFDLPIDIAASLADERDPAPKVASEPVPSEGGPPPDGGVAVAMEDVDEPPNVHVVASIGVAQPDALIRALKANGKDVQEKEAGQYLVELDDELSCLLGPALGPTTHRLTCGLTVDDLDVLAGYANKRLATHPFPDKALHGEVRFSPLRARFGDDVRQMKAALPELLQELRLDNQRFDGALSEAANAVSNEVTAWVDGLDTLSFSAEFAANKEVLLGESTIRFEKDDSYTARLLRRTSAEQRPAPALFWDLPQDVDTASFNTRATVTESERKIAANLTELLAGGIEYAGAATGPSDTWLGNFRQLLEAGGTIVVASGPSSAPPQSKPAKQKSTQTVLDSFGYYLIGVEGDAGVFARAWRSTVEAFNDKRLRTALSKKLEEDLSKLPFIRVRTLSKSKTGTVIEAFNLTFPVPKSELPKEFRADKFSLHLVMATVGERTWFGFSFSEAEASHIVRKLVDAADYPKLATREGLTSLREHSIVQGSFFTLNSYAKMFAGLPFGAGEKPLGDELVRAMPHGGVTPSVFAVSTAIEGPSLTARWELPREIFDDGSALTVAVIAAFGGAWSSSSTED